MLRKTLTIKKHKQMNKTVTLTMLAMIFSFTQPIIAQQDSCGPKIWFQHDDYFDIDGDSINEIAPDMLTRWDSSSTWDSALAHTDVYSIHENLFKVGAPQGMGAKFLQVLQNRFGLLDTIDLYKAYLGLILPVLHDHQIELQIHTVGSKGDFTPWDMYGTSNGTDTIPWTQDSSGLLLVLNTLNLINGVCDSLFTDGYRVTQVKLQSVLSGHWKRGLKNNVYCALEYMKGVKSVYPTMKFYLGNALLQRFDYNTTLKWKQAFDTLYYTMLNDPNGYDSIDFRGIRIEFDKNWDQWQIDSTLFENAQGWIELSDSGAVAHIQSLGWEVGLEHNHPYANDEWEYETLVLRTAEKITELNLNCNFAVLHTDAAGGNGQAVPYYIAPETIGTNDPPTFSSVLNKLFTFYDNYYCNTTSVNEIYNYNAVSIFPNPFSSQTTLQTNVPLTNATLTVDNYIGQTVAQIKSISGQTITFNRDNLPSGLYFVRLTENNQIIATNKIIIID